VLVEDFLHGQGDDDFVAALEEGFDLLPMNLVAADVRRLISNSEFGIKIMSLVTSSPTNHGGTTKPRPARQSSSLSGRPQTSRRRLAMTHRHGRNIYANPEARIYKGTRGRCSFTAGDDRHG
jgi:hypothetical protein